MFALGALGFEFDFVRWLPLELEPVPEPEPAGVPTTAVSKMQPIEDLMPSVEQLNHQRLLAVVVAIDLVVVVSLAVVDVVVASQAGLPTSVADSIDYWVHYCCYSDLPSTASFD